MVMRAGSQEMPRTRLCTVGSEEAGCGPSHCHAPSRAAGGVLQQCECALASRIRVDASLASSLLGCAPMSSDLIPPPPSPPLSKLCV